jgi:hypothetical protein
MAIKNETVIDQWNNIVVNGAGKAAWLMDTLTEDLKKAQMPNVLVKREDVSSGMFSEKRQFVVVDHKALRDYRMFIGARDFGTHLVVSWYLTIAPSPLKRMFSKISTGNPQAFSMQMDFFTQQDLHSYVGIVHHCVTDIVKQLLTELEQDPTRLDTKSKGFLSVW